MRVRRPSVRRTGLSRALRARLFPAARLNMGTGVIVLSPSRLDLVTDRYQIGALPSAIIKTLLGNGRCGRSDSLRGARP
jgi:hypothetical protein